MRHTFLVAAAAVSLLLTQSPASAQALKKLEQRLSGLADKLAQPAADEPAPAATSGYLGLTVDKTEGEKGVVVLSTKPGSPAETAGLRKGDLITAVNGTATKNLEEFGKVLDQIAAGQRAQFTVMSYGEALTLSTTLVARPAPPVNRLGAEDPGPPPGSLDPLASAPPPPATPAPGPAVVDNSRATLGISVVPLTEQTRAATGTAATRGAYVAAIKAGGPAERAGIPVGAVVVNIDRQRVDTPDDLVGYIASARPGQEVELSYYRGATLTRKTARLAPAALDARGTPAAAPSGIGALLGGGGDRPVVRGIERVIDNLARPAGGVPAGQFEDVATLKNQIELLQATVRSLEERLMTVEKKLGGVPPGAGRGIDEGGARLPTSDPVRRLELKLAPPDKPALPTPPATP